MLDNDFYEDEDISEDELTDASRDDSTYDYEAEEIQGSDEAMTPDDYKFDRSNFPEDADYDEEMESDFRQWAFDANIPKSAASSLYEKYNYLMSLRQESIVERAKETEEALRSEWPDFDEKIGGITNSLLTLSEELGLNYRDDEGNPQSHLIDDLELNRKGGQLGDKASLIKCIDHLLVKSGMYTKAQSGQAFSDDFYNNPESGAVNKGESVAFSKKWFDNPERKETG